MTVTATRSDHHKQQPSAATPTAAATETEGEGGARAFMFGMGEAGSALAALIAEYHERLAGSRGQARGLARYAALLAATTHAGFNNVGHLLGEYTSNEGADRRKAVVTSGSGLALGSVPAFLAYLKTGDPHLAAAAGAGTSALGGAIGAGLEEREQSTEKKSWRKLLLRRDFAKKLLSTVGIQTGTGVAAMGLAQYGGATTLKLLDGATLANAASHLSGGLLFSGGLATIATTLIARRLLGNDARKGKWTKKDRRREAKLGVQEGTQMAGVNAVFAHGLGISPKLAFIVAGWQSLVNGVIHAGGASASNTFGKRLKAGVTAFGAVAVGSVFPLATLWATASPLLSSMASLVTVGAFGFHDSYSQQRKEQKEGEKNGAKKSINWKQAFKGAALQAKMSGAGIWLAHVGAVAIKGAIAAGAGGAMAAVAASPVAVAGLAGGAAYGGWRYYQRRKKRVPKIGSAAWDRQKRRLTRLQQRADRHRAQLNLAPEWREHSATLRALCTPAGIEADAKNVAYPSARVRHRFRAARSKPLSTSGWHTCAAKLASIEQKTITALERLDIKGWEEPVKKLQSLHMPSSPVPQAPAPA